MNLLRYWILFFCLFKFFTAEATLTFSNDSSKFILQNTSSEIRVKNIGIYDKQALGISDNLNRIDLVNSDNNNIILDNDFQLEAGFLFSTSGTIQGNGYSMILNGDLIIPEMTTLKITSSLIIEGNGHTLLVDNFAQILTDSHATLTLRNLIIKNVTNTSGRPALAAGGLDSKITLDGVSLYFNDDFWFNRGSLFFHNNVLYSGGSKFLYGSTQPSYVAPSSTLTFDEGTTLFYCPMSVNDNLIVQQDPSSTIYFNGCTLQSTPTGLALSEGRMFFENQVKLDVGTEFNTSLFGINQTDSKIYLHSMDWDFSGQFLAVAGKAINGNTNQLKIYELINSTNLSELYDVKYGSLSSIIYSAAWSPDAKYLAVGGCGAGVAGGFSNNNNLRIYYFDPATLSLSAVTSVDFGSTSTINSLDWGGVDGYYLSVGGTSASPNNLKVYHFDQNQSKLSAVTSFDYGPSVNAAKWDFSGSYLAVGGFQSSGSCNLNLFTFNPVSGTLTLFDTKIFGIAADTSINALAWTSESQFLAVGGGSTASYSGSNSNIVIYEFDPSIVIPLTFLTFASPVEIASTDYIVVQNLLWSTDNSLLLYSGINPATGHWSSDIYSFNSGFDIKLSELKRVSYSSNAQQYAAAWNPKTDLVITSSNNYVNANSLVGVSPQLIANRFYTTDYSTDSGVYSIDWHSSGDYLVAAGQGASATGGFSNTDEIRCYRFDSLAESLYPVSSQSYGTSVYAASFSPDGNYLAVAGVNPTYAAGGFNNNDQIRIYSFANGALTPVTSVSAGSVAEIYSLAWHPSGNYLAIGCYGTGVAGGFVYSTNVRIYSFTGTSLIPDTGHDFGDNSITAAGMNWSPDGKYLAVGTCQSQPIYWPTAGDGLIVFEFQDYSSLIQVASWNDSSAVLSVNWEFDNRFIAVTYNNNYNPLAFGILYFSGSSLQQIKTWGAAYDSNVNFFNTNVKVSPDGKKIATTAEDGVSNDFGYISVDDFNLKNDPFYYQKITGIFNVWSCAWRPDSKYLAVGAYYVDANAQQIAVFRIDNLVNINRQGINGLDLGKLVDINLLSGALVITNGFVSYAQD